MLIQAGLPAATAPDVASYELTYTVDAGASVVLTSTGDPLHFSVPSGSTIAASFVEVDKSGNRSDPSDTVTLIVKDTIAPPKPGPFTLTVLGDDPAPEPTPEPV